MEPIRLIQSETDAAVTPGAVPAGEQAAAEGGFGSLVSSSTLPGILFAGSIVLIVVVLMRHARRKRARLREPTERPVIAHSGAAAAAGRDEVHAVVADAADVVRELAAAVESKAARLEALLRQADERIAALERRTAALGGSSPDAVGIDAGGCSAAEPAPDDRGSVVAMVDRGASDDEIVRATGVAVGEVRLIRRLHAASGGTGFDSPPSPAPTGAGPPRRPASDAGALDAYLEALVGDDGGATPPGAS